VTTPNRRAFLKGLGALGAGSIFCTRPAMADAARYAHRFQLFAQGNVTDFSLVWPAPQIPRLPSGIILRLRLQFPIDGRDIVEWHTFLAGENAPDQPLVVLTLFHMRVDKIGFPKLPLQISVSLGRSSITQSARLSETLLVASRLSMPNSTRRAIIPPSRC
jgi:hypothetical protein